MDLGRSVGLGVALAVLASCGAESDGYLTKRNGKIEVLTDAEADSVCQDQFCEPNYLYQVNFGRRRRRPAPVPVPAPAQPLPPAPSGETIEYSRSVIRAQEAWAMTEGSREVVVAVVDTGVDVNHEDLKENIWVNEAEYNGASGFDDDGNGYVDDVYGYDFANDQGSGIDDNGHGTHCAGIIAAQKNGKGVRGVAPNVRVMPLKFLNESGSGSTADAIRAIEYAIENGANIISNSWGGSGYSQFLDEVIQRAVSQGIMVVAAAGNESSNNDYYGTFPANYSGVISVASSTQWDQLSYFSNYGYNSVTVAAPGSDIYSTYVGGQYKSLSGTSMAAPQVSGILALALSKNGAVKGSALAAKLCSSSKKILTSVTQCGRVDAAALLSSL